MKEYEDAQTKEHLQLTSSTKERQAWTTILTRRVRQQIHLFFFQRSSKDSMFLDDDIQIAEIEQAHKVLKEGNMGEKDGVIRTRFAIYLPNHLQHNSGKSHLSQQLAYNHSYCNFQKQRITSVSTVLQRYFYSVHDDIDI